MIAATNGWVVAFDNLSGILATLSDTICTLATGGGFGTRELYSDDEEKLFNAKRPVMLNGIADLASRSDLMDRSIHLTLGVIPEDQRQEEAVLIPKYESARPRILGALLDGVSAALRNLPTVRLNHKPRMADFAAWATAAETAMGVEAGSFMSAYAGNRAAANDLAIESSPIGPAVVGLMHDRELWQGTVKELMVEVEAHQTDEKTRKRRDWPKTWKAFGGALRRLAPNLRAAGVDVRFPDHRSNRGRIITLEQVENQGSQRSRKLSDGVRSDHRDHQIPTQSK